MNYPIRYATASQEVPLGPFLDSTDGDTEESGLTIANTDIKLHKAGATTLASKNSGGATYISNGVYYAVLDATDSDTLGALTIFVHVAGALAVKLNCTVLPANVYDSLISGTEWLETTSLRADFDIAGSLLTVKKQDGSTTQFTKTITTSAGADPIIGLD